MSLKRLTAGNGYDYLTRQVAAMDSTEKGRVTLSSYYTEKGETPGRWLGSGMAGIDGLNAGDLVNAEQMQALFGAGFHPLATERSAALQVRGATSAELLKATRLGSPFNTYEGDVSPFRARSPAAWRPSTRLAGCRRTHRCRSRTVRGSAPRLRSSCSPRNTGEPRWTPES